MAGDSVTFRLDGEVTIEKLSDAVSRFARVLKELESSEHAHVRWVLSDLGYGSAIVTARAVPVDEASAEMVPGIVDDFISAARAVQLGVYDRSQPLLRLVRNLTEVADETNRVVIETEDDDVVFIAPVIDLPLARVEQPLTTKSLGSVRGRIETLSHRKGLRFTLYELSTDRAVLCYLQAGAEELMRGSWGRVADVTGLVVRDAGRPIAIRRVSHVDVVDDEGGPTDYRRARGVAEGDEPAEAVIRRIRDAI